ncbi:hypothetical protein [Nitrosomonas ureae]|uniref:Uncharacterized protein n=1 Tax=Nitrosomonas ureae TaxID=44577 RepID=A0A1H2F3W2_9PROT|nr:hypothetical protein [Nitrosomonas ureae]ALQ51798.1 hypothetical protein ATY38_11550 [Nitrosomonas ureae]SDU02017.1 hypothetical protein SAMN05216406_11758 [Nitrosomonas ureae]
MTEKTNADQGSSDSPQSPDSKLEQDWQDILAERTVHDADPVVRAEAEALREAILQKYQEELKTDKTIHSESDQSKELDRLLKRLKKENLLDESKPYAQTKWFRSFNFPAGAFISAAAVLVISLTLWIVIPSPDEPLLPQTSTNFKELPRFRSEMVTQPIPVDSHRQSRETARQLIEQLKALNVAYRFTPLEADDKSDWKLEIYIPFEPEQNILTFLQQWRLKEAEDGWIQIAPEIKQNQ